MPERNGGIKMIQFQDGYMGPILVKNTLDGKMLTVDQMGYISKREDMIEFAHQLLKSARSAKQSSIDQYNLELDKHYNPREYGLWHPEPTKPRVPKPGYLYLIKCADKYKIGMTKNVGMRLKQLDMRPFKAELVKYIRVDDALGCERSAHKKFAQYKITGEWYSFTPAQVQEVMDYFAEVAR